MDKTQRRKLEMFRRVWNFGIGNRDAFPEESAAGKKFGQLAGEVALVEEQLVRQGQARTEARKVKLATRKVAWNYMKAIASAGRRATTGDVGPHPFRLPSRRAATVVLATARLFIEEAERRKDRFEALGFPPSFLPAFVKAVDDLAAAVELQQGSRGTRSRARGTLNAALGRGMQIVADLDATVPASLWADAGRLAEWLGARRMDQPGDANPDAPAAAGDNQPAPAPAGKEDLKVAS